MRRRSIKIWSTLIGAVVIAVCILGAVDVHKKYFFNPLTYRHNDVLYLPWKWYTKPLNMQIFEIAPSLNKLVEIKDPKQITYVISELEKGSKLHAIPASNLTNRPTNAEYGIYIRTAKNLVLQGVYVYPKEKMAQISTQHGNVGEMEYVALTQGLLSFINKEMGQ